MIEKENFIYLTISWPREEPRDFLVRPSSIGFGLTEGTRFDSNLDEAKPNKTQSDPTLIRVETRPAPCMGLLCMRRT